MGIINKLKNFAKRIPYKNDLPIVFILVLIVCLFLLPPFIEKDFGGDFIEQTVPWYHFLYTNLRHGIIPFWSPYSLLGLPFLFSPSIAVFHPFTLLVIVLNFIFNFHNPSIEITGKIIQYVIAISFCFGATGMYVFCKKILNVSRFTALFAGIAFSLNPFLIHDVHVVFVDWGINSLPWIFLLLVLFLSKPSFKTHLGITLLNLSLLATGYPYYYIYFILAEIFLAFFYGRKKIALFFLSLLNSLLLAGFFLLPYLMVFLQYGRSENVYDFTWHSFASQFPTGILLILNPLTYSSNIAKYADFSAVFSGAVLTWGTFAFVFLIYGLFFLKNKPIYFWTVITFFITLFYSFGSNLASHSFFGTLLPIIYKFRSHARIFSLTVFAGVILIALGIDAVNKRLKVKYVDIAFWFICISVFIGLILGPVFFWSKIASTAEFYKGTSIMFLFLFCSLIIISMTVRYGKKIFLVLGLVIMLLEYHYYLPSQKVYFTDNVTYDKFYRFNPTIPELPSSNNLFRIYFEGPFYYNSSVIGIYGLQGFENNPPNAYGELINRYFWTPRLWQITNVKYIVTPTADFGANNSELVKIKTINPSEYPNQFSSKDYNTPYYVYKIKDYLPRFYVPQKVDPCLDKECFKNENIPELVIAKELSNSIINPKTGTEINIKSYTLNNIDMEITTPKETFIASSETYDNGWSLTIDGKSSKIYFISNGLRGFIVPAGKSVVRMSYFPPYLIKGIFFSIIGIAFLCGIFVFNKKRYEIKI
ncbi:MAG: hypothetical protein CO135_02285 [Candidatus Levybacteria bacterium CG_4_9_14_3_um_filter_35_16]|nr:MAG: hypothetical protein CO135_02285 [Candidatus Levybacteria bacterium CG_4_9_14_3_um_filter_35_16]